MHQSSGPRRHKNKEVHTSRSVQRRGHRSCGCRSLVRHSDDLVRGGIRARWHNRCWRQSDRLPRSARVVYVVYPRERLCGWSQPLDIGGLHTRRRGTGWPWSVAVGDLQPRDVRAAECCAGDLDRHPWWFALHGLFAGILKSGQPNQREKCAHSNAFIWDPSAAVAANRYSVIHFPWWLPGGRAYRSRSIFSPFSGVWWQGLEQLQLTTPAV